VPRPLVVAAIGAIRAGADALLDRDWQCYSVEERRDAELYADVAFIRIADQLEQLLTGAS
jgi:hypothetical protein